MCWETASKNNVSKMNRGRRRMSYFRNMNEYKDVVKEPALWMGKLPETGVRLHTSYLLSWGSVLSRVWTSICFPLETKNRNKADRNLV